MNNDSTAAHYKWNLIEVVTTSVAGYGSSSDTSCTIIRSQNQLGWTSGNIFIDVNDNENKAINGSYGVEVTAIGCFGGSWQNAADHITRIDLICSSGNFLAGSKLSVYGMS